MQLTHGRVVGEKKQDLSMIEMIRAITRVVLPQGTEMQRAQKITGMLVEK